MRNILYLFLFTISTFYSLDVSAQNSPASLGCKDPAIRLQAEEIKQHYIKQGFEVFRDAMITMESQIPYPIIAELHKGQLYQVVLLGNASAQRIKLEVLDGADNLVEERTTLKDQPNYIIYTLAPTRSDAYLFSLSQRIKKGETCGSFFILRLAKENSEVIPYTGARPSVTR